VPSSTLYVDERGLSRVLSEWSGTGSLFRALAEMSARPVGREWSAKDVERRASRILLLECAPLLRQLPRTARVWFDHLPTLTTRTRYWSPRPETRVDWRRTRLREWPPKTFAIRRRHRSTDQLTLSVLAWTLGRLESAFEASSALVASQPSAVDDLPLDVKDVLKLTLPVLDYLDDTVENVPSRDDLAAVRGAGWPWKPVAAIAEFFLSVDRGGAVAMAQRLLRPDGFPETLFQLSILGAIINACESTGSAVTSLRPLASMTQGPAYRVVTRTGEQWELWCEAASCWEHYGADDVYQRLASGLTALSGDSFSARHIRPDILLAKPGEHALVLECKFPFESLDPGYVAHGLYQAFFYAQQLASAFERVSAYSVGPTELVTDGDAKLLNGVDIGLASSSGIETVVRRLLT
jgi:hypothetical protein